MRIKTIAMKTFTLQEKKAARILQSDIPLTVKPFAAIAEACGLSSDELLNWMKGLSQAGILRKFGAILRHQKAGYHRNALVMWAFPEKSVENAGRLYAALPYISHCYERKPAFQNKYNLFTMLHTQEDAIESLIGQMSQTTKCSDFLILESLQEYKKTSPEYF
jgi:DNA-binding Lrp family transcriptional regulator